MQVLTDLAVSRQETLLQLWVSWPNWFDGLLTKEEKYNRMFDGRLPSTTVQDPNQKMENISSTP